VAERVKRGRGEVVAAAEVAVEDREEMEMIEIVSDDDKVKLFSLRGNGERR
jgi:hypothetical protein